MNRESQVNNVAQSHVNIDAEFEEFKDAGLDY